MSKAKKRNIDHEFLRINQGLYWNAASRGFAQSGRGAVIVDTRTTIPATLMNVPSMDGTVNPYAYVPLTGFDKLPADAARDDAEKLVQLYDPKMQYVVILIKPGDIAVFRMGKPVSTRPL